MLVARSSTTQPPTHAPSTSWTRNRLRLLGTGALFLFLAASVLPSQFDAQARAAGDSTLTAQTALSPGGTLLGPTNPQRTVHLSVALKINDHAALESFIQQLNDPASPQYKHFLTPAEFTSRFVDSTARSQVDAFLQSHGLTVQDTGLGTVVNADGSVAQVQNAFHVQLSDYRVADGHVYYANNLTPALPLSLAGHIQNVAGLNNFPAAYPQFVRPTLAKSKGQAIANTGTPTGCSAALTSITDFGGGLTPNEFATAYNFTGVGNTGTGQTVALFELDNYLDSNAASYQSCFSTAVPLQRVLVDGGSGALGNGESEVELDLDTIVGLAPAITKLLVYNSPNTGTGLIDQYQQIANDNLAKVISSSWGQCERLDGSSSATTEDNIFAQFVTQGQDVFEAAGDSGSAGCQRSDGSTAISVEADAAGPHATGVGGTFLNLNSNNTISSEPAWNEFSSQFGATGGGVSTFFSRSSAPWQTGTGTTHYSTTMRQVPDVGADADPNSGYISFVNDPTNCPFINSTNNCFEPIGGTSAATPLWAAGTAILNEFLVLHAKPVLGFANPQLYQVFNSSSYASAFHDIATGSNCYIVSSPTVAGDCGTPGSSTGLYQTSAGYDPVTGIGTPNFGGLALALLGGAATTTTVTSSLNPSTVGQSVTFTAHVTSTGGTPTGTVTFKDGATTLGTGTLAAGTTTFATTSLAAGTHSITAVYAGATGFAGSTSAALSQVVNTTSAATTTTLTSSLNPSRVGQSVTFTAHVTSSGGTPTGTVTFKDGATTLGTGTLASGTTTFATAALAVGTHSITAVYAGATGFTGSTSAALSQVVNASTTTTLTSSLNPSTVGQSVTFTAHVTSTGGTPTGTVTFMDGATTLGTGTLAAGTTTFATTALAAGTHSITAVYAGATGFAASTSAALSQVVNSTSAATTTTLTSSLNPSTVGQSVTFTAHVTSSGGTPTGTVTFKDGATTLGTGTLAAGTTTFATTALAAGTHSITAVYAGATGFAASTSAALSQVVNVAATGPIVVHGLTIKPVHAVSFANGTVGSITDPKAGTVQGNYTATIDWGDGTATTLGTVVGSAGNFNISGTHTYAVAGFYSINVTIGVSDGRSAYLASLAQVS
jgi:Pro-kumamolisin, activation domain/Bacterial Ig-like domain (group 3)